MGEDMARKWAEGDDDDDDDDDNNNILMNIYLSKLLISLPP